MSGAMMVCVGTLASGVASAALPFDFSAPPQRVSASFNGTNQYLSAPTTGTNSAFTFTGDFTVEAWVYPTNVTGYHAFWTLGSASANRYTFQINGTTLLTNLYGSSSTNYISTVPISTWTHVAMVRSGSTVSVYINGTASATTDTQAGTIGNGVVRVGSDDSGGTLYQGSMSNFRLVSTAVYTGNFTPPTKPLSAITNTQFLLSLGVYPIIDYSSNAIALTNNGIAGSSITALSPFSANWVDSVSGIVATVGIGNAGQPTYTANYGGGINCEEAVRPYVDVPTTRTGTGGYTISMAANVPTAPSHYVPLFTGNNLPVGSGGRSGNYIYARKWTNFETGSIASPTTNIDLNFSTGALTNPPAWYDWVYNGTSVTVYRNGLYITSFTMSAAAGWLNPLRFAGDESSSAGNSMAIGTLYRMKHQTTALSASAIATQYNTVRSTYGGGTLAGSLSFPGGVAGTRMLDLTTGFTLGGGSYTVEGWFQLPDFTNQYALFGANASAGDGSGMMNLIVSSSTLIFSDKNGGGGSVSYTVPTMSANTWYHYALTRNGTTEALFINGVRCGTSVTNAINYTAATKRIGMSYVRSWPGLMTNMRVVVGSYVYDPAFSFCTVPIGPLTAITNTKYLMLGAVATTDSSGFDTVTNTGSVTTSATKPF
jgi:hypothetical protein